MSLACMSGLSLAGRRVLIREDLNVPVAEGRVTSDARIRAALPTLRQALEAGAAVMVMSHLGRPREGVLDERFSLAPVAARLSELLGREVPLVRSWLGGVELEPGDLVLLENVRFNPGETANDEALARQMAALADVYVMDAFGTAHRAQASTHGVARFAPIACAGPLLLAEVEALGKALERPARPLVAIVGGAKVSTKLEVLESLAGKVDRLVVGGGIANTFIAAEGHEVGRSLYEPELLDTARRLVGSAQSNGARIPVPVDVVVGDSVSAESRARVTNADSVAPGEMILDLGPRTVDGVVEILERAGTIVWNGPVGVFELPPFAAGTRAIAAAIGRSPAFSIAGGGDTLAAIDAFGVAGDISYISTGGGAFLEVLEGKTLPAIAILEARSGDQSASAGI